jgi:hypothetical protein
MAACKSHNIATINTVHKDRVFYTRTEIVEIEFCVQSNCRTFYTNPSSSQPPLPEDLISLILKEPHFLTFKHQQHEKIVSSRHYGASMHISNE